MSNSSPLTLIAQVILNMVSHALCLYTCYSLDGIFAHSSPCLFEKLLLVSNGSGSQKSKIKVAAGLCSLQGSGERSVLCLSSSLWQLLAIFGVPWLIDTSTQTQPPL